MSKIKKTASADLNPASMTVGKWIVRPLTVNTLILLEKIGSPFMADDFDAKTSRYKDGRKLSMEEMIRSFYVMVNAEDPRLDEQVNDPAMFQRCVSNMAREISMADLAKMTASINEQMGKVNKAVQETGAEGDGVKKETGPVS
jgi:hypothetical protein